MEDVVSMSHNEAILSHLRNNPKKYRIVKYLHKLYKYLGFKIKCIVIIF